MRAVTIEPLDPEKIKSLEKEQVDIEKKLESSGSDRWNKNRKILVQHLRHYEWNCPDWCEGDDYPENNSALNDWQWKWEFIRRLPSYRYAFLYFQNRDGALDWLRNGLGMDEYIDPRLPVNEIPEDPFKKYRGGTFLDFPTREYIENEFFEVHGLTQSSDSEKLKFLLDYLDSLGLFHCSQAKKGSAFIRIEWYRSLMPQKERICFLLDEQQKRRSKHLKIAKESNAGIYPLLKESWPQGVRLDGSDRGKWPLYLRIIDAWDQKLDLNLDDFWDELITDPEMREKYIKVNQPRARVNQWRKQAVEVMEKTSLYL